MAQDILIIIDCLNYKPDANKNLSASAVSMYAADPKIVQKQSQGSTELWVKVPIETNLRWRAVPNIFADEQGNKYQALVTQVKLWKADSTNDQVAPLPVLKHWFPDLGGMAGAIYESTNEFQFPANPGSDGAYTSNQAPVQTAQRNDPYVQATCSQVTATNQDPDLHAAYSLVCSVYQDGKLWANVTWDPYVIVTLT